MPEQSPTGVEVDPQTAAPSVAADGVPSGRTIRLPRHVCLSVVHLTDQTDLHNELVQIERRLLHPVEKVAARGCLFIAEETLTGRGWVFVKLAPLPHARASASEVDLSITPIDAGYEATLHDADGYRWRVAQYEGGPLGRAAALQSLQREARSPLTPMFITNTWGDRSRDGRINEAFILQEIEAAAGLGADVVQIDDGWQRGRTANSMQAQAGGEGVWEGFYAFQDDFWTPDPERFPRGFEPIVDAAREAGVNMGLWFAPDSSNDFANWKRDAQTMLGLHRQYGVDLFKLDSINMRSGAGEANIRQMIQLALAESDGRLVFDLDVTAHTRPGYFGLMEAGPLFVENRYTDWHSYWPHHTLRNLWSLAGWVDPLRLRMEWLNVSRNTDRYAGDPLAPSQYTPDYLFATVMFAQPLGWFECSQLPEEYFDRTPALIACWKQHREAIFDGVVLPIGNPPDGASWTGFASIARERGEGYVLVFREAHEQPACTLTLPPGVHATDVTVLHASADGRVQPIHDALHVQLDNPRSFIFAKMTIEQADHA